MAFLPPNPAPPPGWGGQLTIETPEQTSLEFALAGTGSRFLALALDTLIQIAIAAIVILVAVLVFRALPGSVSTAGVWIGALVVAVFFLIYYGYFIFFEAVWNGQTLGKRAVHIRVIKDDGRTIQTIDSVGRNLLRIVDQLPVLYAIGIASVLLSRKSQRLGDLVAGTIVVHERALADIKPIWQSAPVAEGMRYGSERLTPEELTLVETFLNRRDALEASVRYNTAEQIVTRIRPKLLIPAGSAIGNESLLEAVASERRSSARYA
jgi:uncharacterized RDD family membrane protein YckC